MAKRYEIRSQVWLHPGEGGAWHFANTDKRLAAQLKEKYTGQTRGFGSIPVEATIGKTKWMTSIFPEKRSGVYILPLKASVRRAEGIEAGDTINFTLDICL